MNPRGAEIAAFRAPGEGVKVSVRIRYTDGTFSELLEIKRATVLAKQVPKVMLHIDETDPGEHLLLVNERLWPEDKRIDAVEIVRDPPCVPVCNVQKAVDELRGMERGIDANWTGDANAGNRGYLKTFIHNALEALGRPPYANQEPPT